MDLYAVACLAPRENGLEEVWQALGTWVEYKRVECERVDKM